jgi:DNA (cytosine-5)-methyltransferase 1
MKKIKNFSLFSNSGIGEYGTNNISILFGNDNYKIETVLANELLEERANIFKSNYPETNMITGSITDKDTQSKLVKVFKAEQPDTGTFSPPCQGSSGLNAFKSSPFDFRNQLVKSVFKIFESVKENNSLKLGYIENVVAFYNEDIPGTITTNGNPELLNDYIVTKDNQYLNFQYFILTNDLTNKYNEEVNYEMFELSDDPYLNPYGAKYALAFNESEILTSIDSIRSKITSESLITPINTFDFIRMSLDKYGFDCELQTVRGEEYGGCQVRQRGFVLFYKKGLKIDFPERFYKKSTHKEYDGKRILDSLEILDLIKIIDEKDDIPANLKDKNYIKKNGKIYIDMSISEEEAQSDLLEWNENGCDIKKIPNLHFRNDLKERFRIWLENTQEGTSAYKNIQRNHRPYKLIEVRRKNGDFVTKSDQSYVVREDTKEYFEKEHIIDYVDYVTADMKDREGIKEWGKDCRKWQIKNIQDRKDIEGSAIAKAKELLSENGDVERYLIFMPIKGFEAATYKRASLNKVSSALTTKNGIGNSNTCHPIFNRTWTPKEYMAMFGIGYIYEDGEYKKSKEYIPPKGVIKIRSFANLLFEIHGEAIISTVAEQIMKSIVEQLLIQGK